MELEHPYGVVGRDSSLDPRDHFARLSPPLQILAYITHFPNAGPDDLPKFPQVPKQFLGNMRRLVLQTVLDDIEFDRIHRDEPDYNSHRSTEDRKGSIQTAENFSLLTPYQGSLLRIACDANIDDIRRIREYIEQPDPQVVRR